MDNFKDIPADNVDNILYVVNFAKVVSNPKRYTIVYLTPEQMEELD